MFKELWGGGNKKNDIFNNKKWTNITEYLSSNNWLSQNLGRSLKHSLKILLYRTHFSVNI
jgi:hypothetical protein